MVTDPLRPHQRGLPVGLGHQHDELLAAVAGVDVLAATVRAQDAGHAPQDLVTRQVAVGIVVALEVVHIEQHE